MYSSCSISNYTTTINYARSRFSIRNNVQSCRSTSSRDIVATELGSRADKVRDEQRRWIWHTDMPEHSGMKFILKSILMGRLQLMCYFIFFCGFQEADQGAYSCEGINIHGSEIAVPDTILVVKTPIEQRPTTSCPRGTFNDIALSQNECINCFCFGISSTCRSSKLFKIQV